MTLGIDTSIIVPCVHANHPLHTAMAAWINRALDTDRLMVAHHSLLEAFAVLTRLPAEYRLSPAEAFGVLRESFQKNVDVAPFDGRSIWAISELVSAAPAAGGAAYDAFIIRILVAAGVDAIATRNTRDFRRLSPAETRVIDPLE